jgi:Gram-negative bacterial TonB protein C-terminal
VVCTVVDAHWYILQVSAYSGSQKPADFDTAVATLQNVRFGMVKPTPQVVSDPGDGSLPRARSVHDNESFYPPYAIRRGEEGDVDVEFRIDGRGQPRDINETYVAYRDFVASAERMVSGFRFEVPNDWEPRGADKQVFTIELQYSIRCAGHALAYPPRVFGSTVIAICAGFPLDETKKSQ